MAKKSEDLGGVYKLGAAVFTLLAAVVLLLAAQPMVQFAERWRASEAGSLYDLTLTGLTAMSSMVFVIGLVIIIYVGIQLGRIFKV